MYEEIEKLAVDGTRWSGAINLLNSRLCSKERRRRSEELLKKKVVRKMTVKTASQGSVCVCVTTDSKLQQDLNCLTQYSSHSS